MLTEEVEKKESKEKAVFMTFGTEDEYEKYQLEEINGWGKFNKIWNTKQ